MSNADINEIEDSHNNPIKSVSILLKAIILHDRVHSLKQLSHPDVSHTFSDSSYNISCKSEVHKLSRIKYPVCNNFNISCNYFLTQSLIYSG
jgi:hypothetical protein